MAPDAKAIVLLSGGLDSATALAMARAEGFRCLTLSVDYGQRHRCELDASRRIAETLGAENHSTVRVDLRSFGGSALTDDLAVPKRGRGEPAEPGIPVTYVPARNLVFLSLSVAHAEASGARDVFIGVNAVDYSGYPDCRPAFVRSFEATANLATRLGTEGPGVRVHAPLLELTKAEIIRRGASLGVDYAQTVSCYDPDADGLACGACDACWLRRRGFESAGVPDPTRYAAVPGG